MGRRAFQPGGRFVEWPAKRCNEKKKEKKIKLGSDTRRDFVCILSNDRVGAEGEKCSVRISLVYGWRILERFLYVQ